MLPFLLKNAIGANVKNTALGEESGYNFKPRDRTNLLLRAVHVSHGGQASVIKSIRKNGPNEHSTSIFRVQSLSGMYLAVCHEVEPVETASVMLPLID